MQGGVMASAYKTYSHWQVSLYAIEKQYYVFAELCFCLRIFTGHNSILSKPTIVHLCKSEISFR